MLMTKEEFKQRIMDLGPFTSEEFDKLFKIVPCNCIGLGCAGWDIVRKVRFVVLEGGFMPNGYIWSQDPVVKELRQIKHEGNTPDCPDCGEVSKGCVAVNFIGREPWNPDSHIQCDDWYCYRCSKTFN